MSRPKQSQTKPSKQMSSQSINEPTIKKPKKTRKIGITIDKSNNQKRQVTGGCVVGHAPPKLEPSQTNKKTI
jgi:hypothetical protein